MKRRRTLIAVVGTAAVALIGLAAAGASPGLTTLVSINSDGVQGNLASYGPVLNQDASIVAFLSDAENLVPGDTNGQLDIFVHDRNTGQTTRVSVSDSGQQANNHSFDPKMTPDGRFVVYASLAFNLVPGDTNGVADIYLRDRQTGDTSRISLSSEGGNPNNDCNDPTISADGRFIAYRSRATNLVPGDTNDSNDIFLHDRQTGETTRVSVASDGSQGNDNSIEPDISDNGDFVAFSSKATNLVAGDANGRQDVFVHDRQTGETTLVSVRSSGTQGNKNSDRPVLSSNGLIVAFDSDAANLVAGDTNRKTDVFVHNRQNATTVRVSVRTNGAQGNKRSYNPDISGDGSRISFNSDAKLDNVDTNGVQDVVVHNRLTGVTTLESVASDGSPGNGQSIRSSLSVDGSAVSFGSVASNLVEDDTNGERDIFIHELGP